MHRADLHDALQDLVREVSNHKHDGSVTLELGQRVTSIDCEQGILTLDTGTKINKDLLVIADGAHVSSMPRL